MCTTQQWRNCCVHVWSISEIESRNNQSVTLIVTDPIYLLQRCTAIWSFIEVVTILQKATTQKYSIQKIPINCSRQFHYEQRSNEGEYCWQCQCLPLTFKFDHKNQLYDFIKKLQLCPFKKEGKTYYEWW